MSDNLTSYIKEYHLDENDFNSGLLEASTITSRIRQSSLPYSRLFSKHKYTLPPLKEIDQLKIISKLLLMINEASSNQPLLIFLSDLCIKLINEGILIPEQANTLIHFYFFSSHCCGSISDENKAMMNKDYFNQYIRIIVSTHNQSCFDILQSFESSLLLEAKMHLLQSENLIAMLYFNNSIEFIALIIKWNYSQSILSKLIAQLASLFFKRNCASLFFIVHQQIELLKCIKLTEQIEFEHNPSMLMNGIEIVNGFYLGASIPLPNENFGIEFSFIKHEEKDEAKRTIISFSCKNDVVLSFYIKNSHLYIFYYNSETELIPVEYGKTIHVILKQTLPSFISFSKVKAQVYINSISTPFIISPSDYLKGNLDFKIGSFRGQLGKVSISKQDNVLKNESIELLIEPIVLLNQYQQRKEYKLINILEPNVLMKNVIDGQSNDAFDRPFECISFQESFNDNEGIPYLLLIMFYLQSSIKRASKEGNAIDSQLVYKCLQSILELVFDLNKDSIVEHCKETSLTLFYSINLLIDQLTVKEKIPQSLILLFLDQIPLIPNIHLRNNLFMILINPSNIAIEHLELLIKVWPNFIDKADKYTTIFMLQSLMHFYQLETPTKKGLSSIISRLLAKAKEDIKVFYLDKVLQINHTRHLYKLLKLFYLSLPQKIKEPLGTFAICNTLYSIYEEHSVMKDQYSVLLQALIIRLIDEIFIRYELKTSKGFIHQSIEVNSRLNESSNYSQNNIILNRIEVIIEKAQVNIHTLRSIFLLVFYLTNQSSNIAFIKNKVDLTVLNYFHWNSKYIIPTVFKVINQLKPKTPEYNEYSIIFHEFLNEILNKIGENSTQKYIDIFESQKIFGDIYMNIIQTKAFSQEEIIRDFTLMIEKTFIYHSNPFYFNFIYRITPFDQQAQLIQPILSKMINYKYQPTSSQNATTTTTAIYLSNNKNLIILLHKLIFFSSIEKKCLYDFVMSYIKNSLNSPLIYTRLLYEVIRPNQKLFLIEMLIEMIIEFYIQNKEAECSLLKSLLLLSNEKKEIHTIFYYIDIWDSAKNKERDHYGFIKEIVDSEERIQDNSGIRNPYLLLNYFAIRICFLFQRDSITQSKLLLACLDDLLKTICDDLNMHNEQMSKLKKKSGIKIQVNDVFYRKFKSRIKNKFKANQIISPKTIREIYNELINQNTNNASALSYDTCDSNIVEPSNIVKSDLSISETYSINKNSTETNSTFFFDLKSEEKHLNRWFKLIKTKGIKLIHKAKTELMKGSLAIFFKESFFYNEQFSSLVFDSFSHYIRYQNDSKSEFLLYPSKIRNYTTDNFTKPFLSINRLFFNDPEFIVGHSYLKGNLIDTSIINDYPKYFLKFNYHFHLDCELMKMEGAYYSVLYKYKNFLVISTKYYNIDKKYPLASIAYIDKPKQVLIDLAEIREVIVRRFMYQLQAVELFLFNGRSYLLNLFNKEGVESFFQLLQRVQIKNKYTYQMITSPKATFTNRKYSSKWKNAQLSTFDYILLLNKYAGRSYNDLNQYPVFPWVLLNYEDMSNKEYRRFEYAISIQTEEKRAAALSNYENISNCLDDYYHTPSHFHSHYSTHAVVYYYLNKTEPFTKLNIQFQSGHIDNANRQFYSLHQTLKSIEHTNGNRELLPEFFYLPELFLNLNYVFFGYREGNELINNVILPANCCNEEEIIYLHKEILNSTKVGKLIPKWIDNVFGCNQLIKKKESLNVFPGHCYEQIINEKNILKEDVEKIKAFVLNLGQTPMQLLSSPHSVRDRKINSPIKQSNPKQQQANIIKEAQPLASLLLPENILNNLNSFRYIGIDMTDVKAVSYSLHYIIIVSSNRIKVFDKKKFKVQYTIQLDNTFLFMNKDCLIQINDCFHLICANFYDNCFKVFQKDKQSAIHTESTHCFVMALCLGMSNDKETTFYSGSSKGILSKWVFNPSQKCPVIKEIDIIAHQGSVLSILLSEHLSALISSGSDCHICIRNIFSFELLACFNAGYIAKEIMLFDSMMIFAFGKKASGFTLNGVRFTEACKEYYNPQAVGSKLYLISRTRTLIQLNPFDLTQEMFQSDIITKKDGRIIHLHLSEEEKVIDCFLANKGIKRIYLLKKSYELSVEPALDNYIFYPDF